jgi:hypothetical protein
MSTICGPEAYRPGDGYSLRPKITEYLDKEAGQ